MGFGSFASLCAQSPLPFCYVLGPPTTITSQQNPLLLPECSARSIELGNTIIFQAATDFAHIAALAMTIIMILHVRSKFTAVGRREILTFFYLYFALTAISLVLDAGVLQATNSGPFPFFVAAQNGLASALCTCLMINGFVGFQLYEDGTTLSVWLVRGCSAGMFCLSFVISIFTFKSLVGFSPTNTTALFIVLYLLNAIFLTVYFVMQVILVVNTLEDRWPLGDIAFGVFFLVIGQVILYVFGAQLCEGVSHYLDGLFFATICNLLAVMMVYKYWDSITKEDLEFSVGAKQGNWDVKESLLDPNLIEGSEYRASVYDLPGTRGSIYNSHEASSLDYQPITTNQMQQRSRARSRERMSHGNMLEARRSYTDLKKGSFVTATPVMPGAYDDHYSDASTPPPVPRVPRHQSRESSRHRDSHGPALAMSGRERHDRF